MERNETNEIHMKQYLFWKSWKLFLYISRKLVFPCYELIWRKKIIIWLDNDKNDREPFQDEI